MKDRGLKQGFQKCSLYCKQPYRNEDLTKLNSRPLADQGDRGRQNTSIPLTAAATGSEACRYTLLVPILLQFRHLTVIGSDKFYSWPAFNEVLRPDEGEARRVRDARARDTGDPWEKPPIIVLDTIPTCEVKIQELAAGIEAGSLEEWSVQNAPPLHVAEGRLPKLVLESSWTRHSLPRRARSLETVQVAQGRGIGGRNGKESAMAFVRDSSQRSPGGISEKPRKTEIWMAGPGIKPGPSECESRIILTVRYSECTLRTSVALPTSHYDFSCQRAPGVPAVLPSPSHTRMDRKRPALSQPEGLSYRIYSASSFRRLRVGTRAPQPPDNRCYQSPFAGLTSTCNRRRNGFSQRNVYKARLLCLSGRVYLQPWVEGVFETCEECSGSLTSILSTRLGVWRTFQVKASGYKNRREEKRAAREVTSGRNCDYEHQSSEEYDCKLDYRTGCLERDSQKQSSDTHKTPYDLVKQCRERKIYIKASGRVKVDVFTHNNKWFLGADEIEFLPGGSIRVGNYMVRGTPGLYKLLFLKEPRDFTGSSLLEYKTLLELDEDHEKFYILADLFSGLALKSGEGMKKIDDGKNIDYVFFNDPNELVDRLQLLLASQSVGNYSHTNEIVSIIEELKKAGYIR
ncbi:hypothetical protein PR048_021758 [Dryococelus australis]|uniref:DUF8207 domain-containing protein n=1 Tax=Dryococelus australis TaxID=614101 RepID=A0ABQ9GZ66_9NEOP|nr:hypothetical protein PR048_021758 [Dryococelus australis]